MMLAAFAGELQQLMSLSSRHLGSWFAAHVMGLMTTAGPHAARLLSHPLPGRGVSQQVRERRRNTSHHHGASRARAEGKQLCCRPRTAVKR